MGKRWPVFIALVVTAGCSGLGADIGACRGDRGEMLLNQAGVLDEIDTWWEVDAPAALTGGHTGERRPDSDRSRRINSDAAIWIAGVSPPASPHYVSARNYAALRTNTGLVIAGSNNVDGDANSVSVLAFVDPDGALRFAGNCATELFTDSFAAFVREEHPDSTPEQVLRASIVTGDFSQYDAWLQQPGH